MDIVELLNNPWVVAITFFYVGFYGNRYHTSKLEEMYKKKVKLLNEEVTSLSEELIDKDIKMGKMEVDFGFNGWTDDEGLIEDIDGEKFEA